MSKAFGLLVGVGVGLLFAQTCQVAPRDPHARLATPVMEAPAPSPAAVAPEAPAPASFAAPETPDALFARTVRPILAVRCAPCHNPGGTMYARLPFDDPKTVADHRGGVRKRIKGDEKATLEAWLAKVPPAPSEPAPY
jgi:hypothetical protein